MKKSSLRELWRGTKFKLVLAPGYNLAPSEISDGRIPSCVFVTLKETPLVRRGHNVIHRGKLTKKKLRELIARAKEMES